VLALNGATYGVRVTGNNNSFANVQASSVSGANGIDLNGQQNCIMGGTSKGNGGDGVEYNGNSNIYIGATTSNTGSGHDINSSANVIMSNTSGNTGNAINIASASFINNCIFGYYSSTSVNVIQCVGKKNYFSGNFVGDSDILHANNCLSGIFDGDLEFNQNSDGSVLFGWIDDTATLTMHVNTDAKMFTQLGDHKRIKNFTGATTLSKRVDYVTANTTSAGFTVTLPAATGMMLGKEYRIKNTGTGGNNLTVEGTTFADGLTALFVSDGTNWIDFS